MVVVSGRSSSDAAAPRGSSDEGDTRIIGTTWTPPNDGDDVTAVGSTVGRYVVLEEIGRGGMGRVLRAYDPKLQREVALKEVRADRLADDGATRLVAEARAMAMLSHANVVAIYDVEESDDGRVLLVMEYVDGLTLETWLAQATRGWTETVAMFVAAGRGLAAAHATDLLHRDFKPANVLVAGGGVVKVTDFGLAKLGGGSASTDGPALQAVSDDSQHPTNLGSEGLTRAGFVVGTPRYMAPEQHRGEPLSPAADQYAFCVALWAALCGAPPFSGDDIGHAKADGPPPWPGGSTPRPIADAIRRGLSATPDERWPSMDALLEALAHDPAVRRRRLVMTGAAVVLLGVGGIGLRSWQAARTEKCAPDAAIAHLAGAWDDEVRTRAEAAMLAIDSPLAAGVWARTQTTLDEYAADWAATHVDTCEATTLRGEQSGAVMDLRMACLHRAKVQLGAVTEVLATADLETLRRAHELTDSLPPLSRCDDVDSLQADVAPPLPAEADAVDSVRELLARANAARKAGRYEAAVGLIDEAQAELADIAYEPVHAEVMVARGIALDGTGNYDASAAALREGLELASGQRQWMLMQTAAAKLLHVVGGRQRRFDAGLAYAETARGLAKDDPLREAIALNYLAIAYAHHGDQPEAEKLLRRTLELRERALGPDDPAVATALSDLAVSRGTAGAYDEAVALQERALAIRRASLGPEHPATAISLQNLAQAHQGRGDYERATSLATEAIAALEHALGPDHPDVGRAYEGLGRISNEAGHPAEAVGAYTQAASILETSLGSEHPEVAMALGTLGSAELAVGLHAQALPRLERTLSILEGNYGPDHIHLAPALAGVAAAYSADGRQAEASAAYERAIALVRKHRGEEHPNVALLLNNLASSRLATDDFEQAAQLLEQAIAILRKHLDPNHPHIATALHNLACAHRELGDHDEARRLETQALAIWEGTLGRDHPEASFPIVGLARDALAAGDATEAMKLAEEALRIREDNPGAPNDLAEVRVVLARALWQSRTADRARPVELAELAGEAYRDLGEGYAEQLAEVEALLDEHGR